jgi:hypothetical protein
LVLPSTQGAQQAEPRPHEGKTGLEIESSDPWVSL